MKRKAEDILTEIGKRDKPNGKPWCTKHQFLLDKGICPGCEAQKSLMDDLLAIVGEDEQIQDVEELQARGDMWDIERNLESIGRNQEKGRIRTNIRSYFGEGE